MATVEEWLDLRPEEVAVIDMKIRLGEELKTRRRKKRLSQERVAEILKTSQGRVSKLEKGQATLDQLACSLLALGLRNGGETVGERYGGHAQMLARAYAASFTTPDQGRGVGL